MIKRQRRQQAPLWGYAEIWITLFLYILLYAIIHSSFLSVLPYLLNINPRQHLLFCNLVNVHTNLVHFCINLFNRGSIRIDNIAVDCHFSKIRSHVSGLVCGLLNEYHLDQHDSNPARIHMEFLLLQKSGLSEADSPCL